MHLWAWKRARGRRTDSVVGIRQTGGNVSQTRQNRQAPFFCGSNWKGGRKGGYFVSHSSEGAKAQGGSIAFEVTERRKKDQENSIQHGTRRKDLFRLATDNDLAGIREEKRGGRARNLRLLLTKVLAGRWRGRLTSTRAVSKSQIERRIRRFDGGKSMEI